jgi:hypothetical protein
MTFEKEMDQFFMRNCYFEKEQEKAKASRAYQLAADQNDPTQAQEIVTRMFERK